MTSFSAKALGMLLLAGLAGCGSGDYQPSPVSPEHPDPPVVPEPPIVPPVTPDPPVVTPEPPVTPPVVPPDPVLPPMLQLWNRCQKVRTGLDPNGYPYPDVQGTLDDERNFLRYWIDELYLWYKEVPTDLIAANYSNPVDYFNLLKTPLLTPSGRPKDRFHFSYPSDQYAEMTKGVTLGYGITWAQNSSSGASRLWRLTGTEAGSVAEQAGLRRGDQLLTVDGEDFVNGTGTALLAKLNAALFPVNAGEQHRFTLIRGAAILDVTLTSGKVATSPVSTVKVLDTPSGKVGYLVFNEHIAASENLLIKAITQFKQAGVTDLVLDMRYNGGGQLNIASELAYMIAGPARTAGRTFELTVGNDKLKPKLPTLFRTTALGYSSPDPAKAGMALPSLDLSRVTVLTGPGTCSASESVINGLRGVDVEVNLIGDTTCGKPYAFSPQPNCGVTYFAVQYKGVNDKGFGEYADGLAPTCRVGDDFTHAQGDLAESQLSAALHYRATGSCPAHGLDARARAAGAAPQMTPVRPLAKEISILN